MSNFNPNATSFDEGIQRIRSALDEIGFQSKGEILTSRHDSMRKVEKLLAVDNVPDGFSKWQLPVFLDGPSQLYVSVGNPGVDVPEHSHDGGDGFRYIVSGSVIYEGVELVQGDWMFIPGGKKYRLKIGDRGALMCYCYCCSCA